MKKFIFFTFVLQLFLLPAMAQKINVGVSLNLMKDYNWDKPLDDWNSIHIRRNTLPLNIGIVVEKQYGVLSPSIGINFINRKISYSIIESTIYHNNNDVNHQMLEIPFHLTYRKKLNNTTSFLAGIGVGMGYVFQSVSILEPEYLMINDDPLDEPLLSNSIEISNPDKLLCFADASIGIENDFEKAGKLQMKLQFSAYITKWLQYTEHINSFEMYATRLYRPYAISAGITYFLPQLCKKK